jgi:hypothetical protein
METFGCLEAETALKDAWKCAVGVSGALSVEICGMTWMLKLCATSSDSQKQVCFHNHKVAGYCLQEFEGTHAWHCANSTHNYWQWMYTLLVYLRVLSFSICVYRCCSSYIVHWWHRINLSWWGWLCWEWVATDRLLSQWAWCSRLHPCGWCRGSLPPIV